MVSISRWIDSNPKGRHHLPRAVTVIKLDRRYSNEIVVTVRLTRFKKLTIPISWIDCI